MSKCKHKWKIIDKTILTHPIADAIRKGGRYEASGLPLDLSDRIVYVFQCEFCFKVKIEER